MRTIDVLIAARDILSDKKNWTTGALVELRSGRNCFCALGAVVTASGVAIPKWNGPDGGGAWSSASPLVPVSTTAGLSGAHVPAGLGGGYHNDIPSLPHRFLKMLEDKGIHLLACHGALNYLQAAVNQLNKGDIAIYAANDTLGYDFIMKALDLAIANAKRRHINGNANRANWGKKTSAPVTQEVAQ